MIITVFEDPINSYLNPLNRLKASFELRCGAFTNLERIYNSVQRDCEIQLCVRGELKNLIQSRYPQTTVNPKKLSGGVWLNGSALWNKELIETIVSGKSFSKDERLIAINTYENVKLNDFNSFIEESSMVSTEINIFLMKNLWDLIFFQNKIIENDAQNFVDFNNGKIHPSVVLEGCDNIFIGNDAEVKPGVVLDATHGPIIIDRNVIIDIGALIQGPIYIGAHSIINPGAKLRRNISIGTACKIGGEIEDVIFESYSNKQHDGFLGHSHVGSWVNLGANTNNSDLKNNYGDIKIFNGLEKYDTKKKFFGSIIGDYVRTGISTMLNTGSIIDICANIFGSDFQPKYVPPFQWGKNNKTELDKLIATIQIIKSRRDKKLNKFEKNLISQIYKKIIN
tara:strand:- start:118 stop:1302 length:1185 start_codon:yes stop_codon:yes gene_type:complete